ncbi:hypothetical protein [Kistimonas asteriae]|uniref:hypothetical protein n=1 Tax=Kistimonas asteriae TaxID=517724 RepID=UPI001BAB4969|nr:hypothetical protein [Kistimonas asteriae]
MDKTNPVKGLSRTLQDPVSAETKVQPSRASSIKHSIEVREEDDTQSIQRQFGDESMPQSITPTEKTEKTEKLTERDIEELQEGESLKLALLNKPKEFILKVLLNRLYSIVFIADIPIPERGSAKEKIEFCKQHRKTLVRTLILAEAQSRDMYKNTLQALKNDTEYPPKPVTVKVGCIQYEHHDFLLEMRETEIALKKIVLSKDNPKDITLIFNAQSTVSLTFTFKDDKNLQDLEEEACRIRAENPDEFESLPHISLVGRSVSEEPQAYRLVIRIDMKDFELSLDPDAQETPSVHGFLDSGYISAIKDYITESETSFADIFSGIQPERLQENMEILIRVLCMELLNPTSDSPLPKANLTLVDTTFKSEKTTQEEPLEAEASASHTYLKLTHKIETKGVSMTIPENAAEVMTVPPKLPAAIAVIYHHLKRTGIINLDDFFTSLFPNVGIFKEVIKPLIKQARKKLPDTVDGIRYEVAGIGYLLDSLRQMYQRSINPIQSGKPDNLCITINNVCATINSPIMNTTSVDDKLPPSTATIKEATSKTVAEMALVRSNFFIRHPKAAVLAAVAHDFVDEIKGRIFPRKKPKRRRATQAAGANDLLVTLDRLTLTTKSLECKVTSRLKNISLSSDGSPVVQLEVKGTQPEDSALTELPPPEIIEESLTTHTSSALTEVRPDSVCEPAICVKINSQRKTNTWPFSGVIDITSKGQLHVEMSSTKEGGQSDKSTGAGKKISTAEGARAAKASIVVAQEQKEPVSLRLRYPLELTATVIEDIDDEFERVSPSSKLQETWEEHLTVPDPSQILLLDTSVEKPRLTNPLQALPGDLMEDLQATGTPQKLEKAAGVTEHYSGHIPKCTTPTRKEYCATLKILNIDEIIPPNVDNITAGKELSLITRILAQSREGSQ